MHIIVNAQVVDADANLDFEQLAEACRVESKLLIELIDAGLLEPQGASPAEWQFQSVDVVHVRAARRLTSDLGINVAGAAVILDLLEERESLLDRLRVLERLLD